MVKKLNIDKKKNDDITCVGFIITSTKHYVPVVTLSIIDNIKQGFKRTISLNKCTSEIITQPKT